MLNLAGFRSRMPEFNQIADARIEVYLIDSLPFVTKPPLPFSLDVSADAAQSFVVAHWCATLPQVDSNGLPIVIASSDEVETMKKVDEITISTKRNVGSNYMAEFNTSKYGKRYIEICKIYDPTYSGSGNTANKVYVPTEIGFVLS